MYDLTDPTQIAQLSDDEASSSGVPLGYRDQARSQVAQAAGTPPETFWSKLGKRMDAVGNAPMPGVGQPGGAPMWAAPDAVPDLKPATNDAADAKRATADAGRPPPPEMQQPVAQAPAIQPIGMPGDKQIQHAIGEEKTAGAESIEAQAAKQAQIDKGIAEAQRQRSVADAQMALDHAQREKEINTAKNQADDWHRQYAEGKIDPDKFYKNEDGTTNYGRKIGAAIAVALGSFGASLSHGPNYALSIINKAIDDDVSAQQANLAKTRDVAHDKQAKLEGLQNKDEHLLDKATQYKMQAYADARQNIADMANSTTDQEKKAKLDQLSAGLDTQAAQVGHQYAVERADLGIKNRQLAIEADRTAAARGAGGEKEKQKAASAQSAMDALAAVKKINRESGTSASAKDRNTGAAAISRLTLAISAAKNIPLKSAKDVIENMVGSNPASMGGWAREGIYDQVAAYIRDPSTAAPIETKDGE